MTNYGAFIGQREKIERGMFCQGCVRDSQAEIGGLVVDEGLRGRGVGRMLMRQAEVWALAQGCRAIRLRSNIVREGAHSFYERLGYSRLKTQTVFRKPLAGELPAPGGTP